MNNWEDIAKNVFIYSPWNGHLKVYEGTVSCFKNRKKDEASFFCETPIKKRFKCHVEPGKVFNAVVWLEEYAPALAAALLIRYEKDRIAALMECVDNHQFKIDMLKGYIGRGGELKSYTKML